MVKDMGGTLSLEALNSAVHYAEDGYGEVALVAPNKRIQKQWEKEYPGYRVLLSAKLPTHNKPLKGSK